jgi:HK97 family phage prohead protease
MTDLRNLPEPVRARLTEAGLMDRRHAGVDIDHKRPTWLEAKTLEQRITPRRIEVRNLADGSPVIRGYAAVYDLAYDVAGGPSAYGWRETVVSGAIDKSVREQDEVYLFFNHDGLPIATTKDGTLTVQSDKIGYYSESRPDPRSQYNMEIVHRLESGALDAMSWAFQALRQEWNKDYTERFIIEAKAFDQSIVNFPANPATVVQVRNGLPPNTERMQQILAELRSA